MYYPPVLIFCFPNLQRWLLNKFSASVYTNICTENLISIWLFYYKPHFIQEIQVNFAAFLKNAISTFGWLSLACEIYGEIAEWEQFSIHSSFQAEICLT
jgi:hypothetical protein